MFKVINWDTNAVIVEFAALSDAKKVCRNQGHTGETDYWKVSYFPVARVNDENGCVYNPVFKVGKDDNFKKIPFVNRSQRVVSDDERLNALGLANMQTAHNQLARYK